MTDLTENNHDDDDDDDENRYLENDSECIWIDNKRRKTPSC